MRCSDEQKEAFQVLSVHGQTAKLFWEKRSVRADIVMEYYDRRIKLDTKWKTPINNTPADADLK